VDLILNKNYNKLYTFVKPYIYFPTFFMGSSVVKIPWCYRRIMGCCGCCWQIGRCGGTGWFDGDDGCEVAIRVGDRENDE
jgi:hypothetical protein